ncbi:hypothetical protein [Sabulibacter ruber]|uniref:hypothetical protein n=1 Tax=Sabulibacter ruber TaxID=2811901 RepID=UPI001A97D052|nr:hypothetical protein [Sabulibacter ruber]
MERLRAYNQKLLAFIGTLIAAGVLGLFLVGAFLLVIELFDNQGSDYEEAPSISLPGKKTGGTKQQQRKQEISFHSPDLIDTATHLYLIPVSLRNTPQNVDQRTMETMVEAVTSSSRGYREGYHYEGAYSNIVLYDQPRGTTHAVFNQTVNLGSFRNFQIKGQQYLLIKGCRKDTNQDAKLNEEDLQSFYVYDVAAKRLQEISFPNMGLETYTVLHQSDQIVLSFGVDQNQDGILEREPMVLKRYSLTDRKAVDLINPNLVKQLQGLVK